MSLLKGLVFLEEAMFSVCCGIIRAFVYVMTHLRSTSCVVEQNVLVSL